jgi:surface polysaccharide O-acyltransferase-like enzyme
MFIPYLGYYLIGFELRRLAPIRLHAFPLWGAFLLGAIGTVGGTYMLVKAHGVSRLGLYMYEYLSPNVILMSVSLFCLASKFTLDVGDDTGPKMRLSRVVAWTAPLTLGIYTWHPMAILALRKLGYTAAGTGSVFGVLFIALPAFGASLALTWAMSKIPLLRQSVGL